MAAITLDPDPDSDGCCSEIIEAEFVTFRQSASIISPMALWSSPYGFTEER